MKPEHATERYRQRYEFGDKYCQKRDELWWMRTSDFVAGFDAAYALLAEENERLTRELEEANESAREMDAKYWAEFNRHEETKARAQKLVDALEVYASADLYTQDEDACFVKPGKIGWDDPPTYSAFDGGAREAIDKFREG